jgi:cytochrome c551/c552
MKTALLALAAAGLMMTGTANAQSGAELFKAKGCGNCHDATAKKVGPSVQDITAKHKGSKGAVDQLAEKLQQGKGHMKVAGSDAEVKAMVSYMVGAGK